MSTPKPKLVRDCDSTLGSKGGQRPEEKTEIADEYHQENKCVHVGVTGQGPLISDNESALCWRCRVDSYDQCVSSAVLYVFFLFQASVSRSGLC